MAQLPNNNQPLQPGAPQQKQAAGTGFTNLKQVLNANRQNRLGSAVSQGVGNVISGTNQQLGQAKGEFNTGLGQAKERLTKDQQTSKSALDEIGRNVQEMRGNSTGGQNVNTQSVGQPIIYDPNQPRPTGEPEAQQQSGVAPQVQTPDQYENQDKIASFQRLAQGKYEGPQGLTQSESLQRSAQDADSLGRMAADRNGRRGILQRFAGQGQYTQGQQRLDDLLLGQTASGALNQAKRDSRGLLRNVNSSVDQAQMQASQQDALTQLAANRIKGDVGSSVNINEEFLTKAEQDARAQNEAKYSSVKQLLNSGQPLSEDDARYVEGVYSKDRAAQDSNFLGGKDFSDYMKDFDKNSITRQNVSSVDDFNKSKALQAYANAVGRDYNANLDKSKAGTFNNMTGIDFRQAELDALKQDKANKFGNEYNPLQEQARQTTDDLNTRKLMLESQGRLAELLKKNYTQNADLQLDTSNYNKNVGEANNLKSIYGDAVNRMSKEDRAAYDAELRGLTSMANKQFAKGFNTQGYARPDGSFGDSISDPLVLAGINGVGSGFNLNDWRNDNRQINSSTLAQDRQSKINALNELRSKYSSGGLRGRDYGQQSIEQQIGQAYGSNVSEDNANSIGNFLRQTLANYNKPGYSSGGF